MRNMNKRENEFNLLNNNEIINNMNDASIIQNLNNENKDFIEIKKRNHQN